MKFIMNGVISVVELSLKLRYQNYLVMNYFRCGGLGIYG